MIRSDFKFHPTEAKLVDYYLRKRVYTGQEGFIKDIKLYEQAPWLLPHVTNEQFPINSWFYFVKRERRHGKVPKRTVRGSGGNLGGTWTASNEKEKNIVDHNNVLIGRKLGLSYHKNVQDMSKSITTGWNMKEYCLASGLVDEPFQEVVLCHVRVKNDVPEEFRFRPQLENNNNMVNIYHQDMDDDRLILDGRDFNGVSTQHEIPLDQVEDANYVKEIENIVEEEEELIGESSTQHETLLGQGGDYSFVQDIENSLEVEEDGIGESSTQHETSQDQDEFDSFAQDIENMLEVEEELLGELPRQHETLLGQVGDYSFVQDIENSLEVEEELLGESPRQHETLLGQVGDYSFAHDIENTLEEEEDGIGESSIQHETLEGDGENNFFAQDLEKTLEVEEDVIGESSTQHETSQDQEEFDSFLQDIENMLEEEEEDKDATQHETSLLGQGLDYFATVENMLKEVDDPLFTDNLEDEFDECVRMLRSGGHEDGLVAMEPHRCVQESNNIDQVLNVVDQEAGISQPREQQHEMKSLVGKKRKVHDTNHKSKKRCKH
ncbi:unnamed protein product [Cochlearia groenlandica]